MEQQLRQLHRTLQTDADTGLRVLEMAAAFTGRTAYGPASALALGLNRLGLSLKADGRLGSPTNHKLDLCTCNVQQIRVLLQATWGLRVADEVSHRPGLRGIPAPAPFLTDRLLRGLRPEQVPVIVKHVTGSFSSNVTKHKWDPGISPKCDLCQAPETKEHRFLHCPATEHVRRPWRPYVDEALSKYPHWLHGPFAVVPEDAAMAQLVFSTRSFPDCVSPASLALLDSLPRLRFYTDGSCNHPQNVWARHSAWAVVVDLTSSDDDIALRLHCWRTTGQLPACFAVVCQGVVPGAQTINRAELCAIVAVAKLVQHSRHDNAQVWSDSLFAIREHEKTVQDQACTHPDLSNLLQQSMPRQLQLEKVKSHQDPTALQGMEIWHAAGNNFVDLAAKAALKQDYGFLHDMVAGIAAEARNQNDLLYLFYRFLLEISEEEWRLKKDASHGPPSLVVGPEQPAEQWLDRWQEQYPCAGAKFDIPPFQNDWALASSTPPWFTQRVWHWASTKSWEASPKNSRGTTTLELLLDFVVTTGSCPPVHGSGAESTWIELKGTSWCYPTTLQDWCQLLMKSARQLERLSGIRLLPANRTTVRTLAPLGYDMAQSTPFRATASAHAG